MNKGTERLEAFSDGVFGIALTLLVLEFQIPDNTAATTNAVLYRELAALWPSLVAYGISFVVVLVMWINHHELIRLVRKVDFRSPGWNGPLARRKAEGDAGDELSGLRCHPFPIFIPPCPV